MKTTKTSHFTCQSKSFISIFFSCQVWACECNLSLPLIWQMTYSYFEKGCRKKVLATIPKGIMVGFECTVLQRNLKELARKSIKMCSRVLTESNKSRLDSYSRQEQCIDHIPYYLTGLSRAHFFPTTFLEIAVYTQTAKTVFSHLKHFNLTVTLNHRLVSLAGRVTC